MVSSKKRASNNRVSKKISVLEREEKVPHQQAIAMAINMDKRHRLDSNGGYKRVARNKGKRARKRGHK